MFSLVIYQTRIVRVTKKLALKFLERNIQHEKKYNLIVEPRDLFLNNDRARTFYFSIVLGPAGFYYGH